MFTGLRPSQIDELDGNNYAPKVILFSNCGESVNTVWITNFFIDQILPIRRAQTLASW
jgi:hypothetical protein